MKAEKIKVFIVDDDPEDIVLTRARLGKIVDMDYVIESCTDFDEGLVRASGQTHDVYLVDYHMGEHTGLEFIEMAVEQGCQRPIILLTGQGDHAIDVHAMTLGAADYLSKDELTPALLERSIRYSIEKKKAEAKLKEMSFKDGLTGLANRRYFDEVLDKEWRRSMREGSDISLIMIDIDYFKLFNDCYGHVEGDECLQRVSACIGQSTKRPGDLAARYGGEELAVILPGTGAGPASEMGEKLRACIESLAIEHKDTRVADCENITISVGTATMVPEKNSSPSRLIEQADKAMYQAKGNGRNRVASAYAK